MLNVVSECSRKRGKERKRAGKKEKKGRETEKNTKSNRI
jgi:hypothetical protein